MPRQPSVKHPLRTTRVILGLSQAQFAARVGLSGHSIQAIENSRLAMSRTLARRISLIYRLEPEQMRSGENPDHPLFVDGSPVTKDGFSKFRKEPVQTVEHWLNGLRAVVEILAKSADEKGEFYSFMMDLATTLRINMVAFGLKSQTRSMLVQWKREPNNSEVCEVINALLFRSPTAAAVFPTEYQGDSGHSVKSVPAPSCSVLVSSFQRCYNPPPDQGVALNVSV